MTFFPESWSLAIEEWFYLLFPAALWLGLKFTKRFDAVFLSAAFGFFAFSTIGADVRRARSRRDLVGRIAHGRHLSVRRAHDRHDRRLALDPFSESLARAPHSSARSAASFCSSRCTRRFGKSRTVSLAFGDDNYFARTFRFTFVSLGFALLLPWASAWKLSAENLFGATPSGKSRSGLTAFTSSISRCSCSSAMPALELTRRCRYPKALFSFAAPDRRGDSLERVALPILRSALHPVTR